MLRVPIEKSLIRDCMVALTVLLFGNAATGKPAPQELKEFNIECPASTLLPLLDASFHECNNGFIKQGGSCEQFVKVFPKLMSEYDCQRSFDKGFVVPAIWLAGDGAVDDYVDLMWRLAARRGVYKKAEFRNASVVARTIFISPEFENVLDGELAETFSERVNAIRKHGAR